MEQSVYTAFQKVGREAIQPDQMLVLCYRAILCSIAEENWHLSQMDFNSNFNAFAQWSNHEFADQVFGAIAEWRNKHPGKIPTDAEFDHYLSDVFPKDWTTVNEETTSMRQGLSVLLRSLNVPEIAMQISNLDIRNNLLYSLRRVGTSLPEFAWLNVQISFEEKKIPSVSQELESLALVPVSPVELMTRPPSGLTHRQQEFIMAVKTWHLSELAKETRKSSRLRWLARGLTIFLLLFFASAIAATLFALRSMVNERNSSHLAATNAMMAGQVAQIAGTDVVAANTARVMSTQSIATAQVAATSVIQQGAEQLAAQAIAHLDKELDLALLFSVEAYDKLDTAQTRGVLFSSLNHNYRLEKHLQGQNGGILSIAFSPDGNLVATGGTDGNIILRDTKSWLPSGLLLKGHSDTVYALTFSQDGKKLASGSRDKTIRIWNVETQLQIGKPFAVHTGSVLSVAFSPDGKNLASGSEDKTVIVWDVEKGEPIGSPRTGHAQSVTGVAFSPDGKYLATAGLDTRVIFWYAKGGGVFGKAFNNSTGPVWSMAFNQDGSILAVGSSDQSIHLWDTHRWALTGKPLTGQNGNVLSLSFSPDGKKLASGGDDGILLWNINTDPKGQTLGVVAGESLAGHHGPVNAVKFSPDGKYLVSGSSADNIGLLWNVSAIENSGIVNGITLNGHTETVACLSFSPDGKSLASGSWDKSIKLWDIPDKINKDSIIEANSTLTGHEDYVMGIAFNPDGKMLASGSVDKTIRLWDIGTKSSINKVFNSHTNWVRGVAFNPIGSNLASASWDKTVIIWDLKNGQMVGPPLDGFPGAVYSVFFTRDGKKIISSGQGQNNTITSWDIIPLSSSSPAKKLLSFGPSKAVYSISLSPDGQTIAAGGADKLVSLWDITSGQAIGQPMQGHDGDVLSVAFSPDGKMVASGGSDSKVILWDLQTGLPIGTPLSGHTDFVYSVVFRPNGKTLASGGADKKIILWDIDPLSWREQACLRAGRNFSQPEWSKYFSGVPYHKTCLNLP